MQEHETRLVQQMLERIDEYESGSLSLDALLNLLQAALDAGGFSADFVRGWYECWTPLEDSWLDVSQGAAADSPQVLGEVKAFRGFLENARREDA